MFFRSRICRCLFYLQYLFFQSRLAWLESCHEHRQLLAKNEVTLQMLVVVRCYEPRFSIHACAAMSHVDSNAFSRALLRATVFNSCVRCYEPRWFMQMILVVRCYEPRFSVHSCAAMSHVDQNIATLNRKFFTGFAGTKNSKEENRGLIYREENRICL